MIASTVKKLLCRRSSSAEKTGGISLKIKIFIAFGAIYIIWGTTYLAIRFAIATIPPFLMMGCRFLSAGTVLYAWARFRDDHVVRRLSPCSGRSPDRGIACFILPVGLVPCLIVLSDIVRLDCRIYRIRLALENRFPCPGFHLCLRESRHRCFCRLVGWRRNPFPKNSYGCRIDGGRCCGHHISQSRTKSFNGKKRVRKGHRSQIPANRTGCPKIMLEHKEEKCQKRFQCIMRLQPSSCCAC